MGLWIRRRIFVETGRRWNVLPTQGPVWAAGVGLFIGLAFQARYQSAVLSVVVLAVAFFRPKKERLTVGEWASLLGAGIATLGIGALFDRAGYGTWAFPAWGYLRINLMEGRAASFNPHPFWMYFAWIFQLIPTTTLPLLAAAIYLAVKRPLHWLALPTLVYFALHCVLTNKEYRFLFPLVPLSIGALCYAFADWSRYRKVRGERDVFQYRGIPWYRNFWMVWAVSCVLGILVTDLRPANAKHSFMERLYGIYRPDQTWWFRSEYPNEIISVLKTNFYWPPGFNPRRFQDVGVLLETLKQDRPGQETYVVVETYPSREFAPELALLKRDCEYLDKSMPSAIGFLVEKGVLRRTSYFTFWKCGAGPKTTGADSH
jgi:hypothetical protein